MPPTRSAGVVPSPPSRRTIKHVHPLPKGLACVPCGQRRVRCSGERPSCSACVRNARWSGRDEETDHGCSYKDPTAPVEEQPAYQEPPEQQLEHVTELVAARRRIGELEQRVALLEAFVPLEYRKAIVDNFATVASDSTAPPSAPVPSSSSIQFPSTTLNSPPDPSLDPDSPPFFFPSFAPVTSSSAQLPQATCPPLNFFCPSSTAQSSTNNPYIASYTPPPSRHTSPTTSATFFDPTSYNDLLALPVLSGLDEAFAGASLFGPVRADKVVKKEPEESSLLVEGWEVPGWKRLSLKE